MYAVYEESLTLCACYGRIVRASRGDWGESSIGANAMLGLLNGLVGFLFCYSTHQEQALDNDCLPTA